MFCRAEGLLLCHLLFFRAKVQLVKQNIDVLVREGLGGRGESDLLLVREVCVALIKLTGGKKVRSLYSSHRVFTAAVLQVSCAAGESRNLRRTVTLRFRPRNLRSLKTHHDHKCVHALPTAPH